MKISRYLILAAVFAFAHPAQALIVYESAGFTDNTYNEIADPQGNIYNANLPNNGEPWQYVAQVENPDNSNASAVYLGNNYLVTASHVTFANGGSGTSILLDGVNYSVDTSTPFVTLPNSDLTVFRILGTPTLAPIALTTAATGTADLNNNTTTMIGWGEGKGSAISGDGWNWGDATTFAERWATNVTLSYYSTGDAGENELITAFNVSGSGSANVGSASLGDSGSALFQKYGGVWELAGIWESPGTFGASYYANSSGQNTNGADNSYAIEIEPFSSELALYIPEPNSTALLGLGAAVLAWRARRRR